MAGSRKEAQVVQKLLKEYEPRMRAAFTAALQDLRTGISWGRLIEALTKGDLDGAIAALGIESGVFLQYGGLKDALYTSAGAGVSATINAGGVAEVAFRFQRMGNPSAENWIKRHVGDHIVGLTEEAKRVAKDAILAGYQGGQHPHSIAIDLAGKVVGGKRTGGLLGLDPPRAARLAIVRDAMRTPEGVKSLVVVKNGVPTLRYKVNAAGAKSILAAWKAGTAVPLKTRDRVVAQYNNKLLKERADMVAHTETLEAVMAARRESWAQLLAQKGLPAEAVIKRWVHGGGPKEPRPHHVAMGGKQVRGLDTNFVFDNGSTLRFAGDPEGALKERIACTCDTQFYLDPKWRKQ